MGRVAFALLAFLALPAAGEEPGPAVRARRHYEVGLGQYQLGEYQEALREFTAGYALSRRPGFLLNLAQCRRQLGELAKARELYQKFLAEATPNDPARQQVPDLIAEIDRTMAERAKKPDRPVESTAPSAAPSPAVAPPAAIAQESAPAPSPRRPWLPVLLGVGAAAVVAVVALALVFALSTDYRTDLIGSCSLPGCALVDLR